MGKLKKVIKIIENLENQKIHASLQCSKKQRVLTVPNGTLKTKKIMDIEKIANELCVEVYATNNEGTTMIISEIIGERGVHKTYMSIHDKLMKMEKDAKWEVKLFRVRSLKSIHYNITKEEEV